MSIKNLSIIIVLLSSNLFAQYVDPSSIKLYDYIPNSEIYWGGSGGLGFNAELNFYNPNYLNAASTLAAGIWGSASVSSSRYYYEQQETKASSGNFSLMPNFLIQYKLGTFLVGLEYYTNSLFDRDIERPSSLNFSTSTGTYQINTQDANLKIRNDVLQLFVSKKLGNSVAITAGLLTNSYQYKLKNTDFEYKVYSNFFTNQQFFCSVNYADTTEFSLYALFKNQQTEIPLKPGQVEVKSYIIVKNWSEINYPSLLGYGIQANQLRPIKFSLELFHKFLGEKGEASKMNTTIVLGINYLLDNLMFGGTFLYSIKTDPFINQDVWGTRALYIPANSNNFFSFRFNSSYKRNKAKIFLGYQFSKIGSKYNHQDFSNYLFFGLSYDFM